jgi:uncharacterized protein (DUF427 family)
MDEFEIARWVEERSGVTPWWPATESSPRWVRVWLGDTAVADSRRATLYLQYGPPPMLPTYYVRREDVADGVLVDPEQDDEGRTVWAVVADGRRVEGAAWTHPNPVGAAAALEGLVTFTWSDELRWTEEEDPVLAHARDPHKRVDVAPSSRHVTIALEGRTIADSRRPLLLFETALPVRYYLPAEDVRTDLLEPTTTTTACPYKGVARHWSVDLDGVVHEDLVWSYQDPVPENPRIRDLMAFYTERLDVTVDGIPQPRPTSPWS